MVDFKYKYYVDVDIYWTEKLSRAGSAVTIEDFDELTDNKPYYDIYLSSEALNYSDEELYQLIESIAYIHNCFINICFVTDDYFNKLIENFSSRPTISSNLYEELENMFGSIGASTLENGKWKKDFATFSELMKGVRNNELYR